VIPPFSNGCAVFAHKHALALAHASEGGKCNDLGKVTAGQPKAGGSEYLELHGAFSITLRAPGVALLSKVWFPCLALSAGRCFGLVFEGIAGAKGLRRWAGRRRPIVGCRLGGALLPRRSRLFDRMKRVLDSGSTGGVSSCPSPDKLGDAWHTSFAK
jgi:hypothetical protein